MSSKLFVALTAAVLSTGCFEIFNQSSTGPSSTIQLLGGRWESLTPNASALLSSCSNFSWSVTEGKSGSTIGAGTFSATCFGVLQVTGTARATQGDNVVNWTASGVATGGPVTDCAISLSGTGTVAGDELTLTYSGDTCQGAVSGTETLKLK